MPVIRYPHPVLTHQKPVLRCHATIHHYMHNILICALVKTYLDMTITKTINALEDAEFEICEDKVRYTSPRTYLGLQIHERTIVPQQLTIKDDSRTLRDLHQLCTSINLFIIPSKTPRF